MAETVYMCSDCKKIFANIAVMVRHKCSGQCGTESTVTEHAIPQPVRVCDNPQPVRMCDIPQPVRVCDNPQPVRMCDIPQPVRVCDIPQPVQDDVNNVETAGNFSENQSQWARQPTLLLIHEYERNKSQMDEGKLRKNSFWTLVTKKLKEEGYNFTQEQISGRWKTLCRNYKAVKDGNKKSGNGRKDFPYFEEMERIYGNDPAIQPKATRSSAIFKAKDTSAPVSSESDSNESDLCNPPAKKPKKAYRKKSEVLDFLHSFVENQEKRYEKEQEEKKQMHNERMDIMRQFLEKMSKDSN